LQRRILKARFGAVIRVKSTIKVIKKHAKSRKKTEKECPESRIKKGFGRHWEKLTKCTKFKVVFCAQMMETKLGVNVDKSNRGVYNKRVFISV